MAAGSANELEYHLILCRDLQLLTDDEQETFNEKVVEVRKMLSSLINRVNEQRYGNK
jgi:four helix bundle protein